MKFNYKGELSELHPGGLNVNTVLFSSIDGSGGAVGKSWSYLCSGCTHTVIKTHIHIEKSGYTWYEGGSGTVPSGQVDLWSIVAHELGHWIVLGDLPESDSKCPGDSGRATMCTPYLLGSSMQRTPNTSEDKDSALAASLPHNQTCPPNPCP